MYKADRYDLKGRECLNTLEKYYLGDLGFRYWLLGKEQEDLGRRLENAVYLELLRRSRSVAVGKVGAAEVDFVAMRDDGPVYVQVSQSILDDATRKRELDALQAIKENYPKMVLTLGRIGTGDYQGIHVVNAIDWMLEPSMRAMS